MNPTLYFGKLFKKPLYRFFLFLFGVFTMPFVYIRYRKNKTKDLFAEEMEQRKKRGREDGTYDRILAESRDQLRRKAVFFDRKIREQELEADAKRIAERKFEAACRRDLDVETRRSLKPTTFVSAYGELMENRAFRFFSYVVSFPMYLLMLIYSNPYVKFIFERIIMMVFVVFGVTFLVFTILYLSPLDAARNILGPEATADQVAAFKQVYGLDQPYIVQLFRTFTNLFTFNLGKSFMGNEDVFTAIARKFPVTLNLSFVSLFVAVVLAIPAGIISAIKPYSLFDYVFMLVALIGLSMPNFWVGLILILNFSITRQWLPATFVVDNPLSLIMPAIVLGSSLAATVARMTRSSMLEVKNMDYIMTARAKGLNEGRVVMKHILGNAM
ncbi:MAG: ABC transporter permease, partial [Bacillota bacterium]|nr:ABC transporter permease [Bacillota bacterium]